MNRSVFGPRVSPWWRLALAAPALAAAILGGCGASGGQLQKALAEATFEFNSSVRWGRYQIAAAHLSPSMRNAFLSRTEENDDTLQISMVEDLRLDLTHEGRRAKLRYRYHWYRAREGILKRTVVLEEWRWMGTRWHLVGIGHATGPTFPLFDGLEPSKRASRPAPRVPGGPRAATTP